MSKIILMQGLPGSGKSTRAKELADQYGNTVRVGRDQLREMLHFGEWSGRNEGVVKDVQKTITALLLKEGKVVIIDDTNIQQSRIDFWKNFAKENDATIKWEKMTTSIEECIKRDRKREAEGGHFVGESVIIAMAMQHGLYPKPEKGIVICDLDGTLCNIKHRLHFVNPPEGQKKDWKGFFAGISGDTINEPVLDMVMEYEGKGFEIFFVSGRSETVREETEAWLDKAFKGYKPYKAVFMRRKDDARDDTLVKGEIYDNQFSSFHVEKVIDDRPSVIRMWKEKGLDVIDVGDGVEF